jgi:FixJ family two-component response regulator
VDDDASLRRSVSNLLRSLGFSVDSFDSAEHFLEAGVLHTTTCLVLDLRLPGLSGLDLLARLQTEAPAIGVIVLTAHGDEHVERRVLALGAREFLTKPFRTEELVRAVNACLTPAPRA